MTDKLQALQNDLKNATIKELTDCMKGVNQTLPVPQRMILTGKKDEIVTRFATYIISLVAMNQNSSVADVVRVVNETVPMKFSWKYENDEIRVRSHKSKRATTTIEQMSFVPSPFLKPVFRLTTIKICPMTLDTRQSKVFTFTLSDANRKLLASPNACDDRSPYQIRFYCGRYNGRTDNLLMEFPGICELKVNDCVIPGHNLRCIKGKPGTVNPPDISIMIRKNAHNSLELIYVNSGSPFIASAYIVERTPVQSLIDTMKSTRLLTKEMVLEKLQQIQQDADIIMESETLSTKCPLAFTRIVTPIRSKNCNHLQCFDAFTFLTMNEQTPTWSCPVCYKRISRWEDLIVDEYFTEMLQNTPRHIDIVRVEPNGVVTIIDENPDLAQESEEEEEATSENYAEPEAILLDDDDDDDDDNNDNNNDQDDNGTAAHAAKRTNNNIPVSAKSSLSDEASSSFSEGTTRVLTPDVTEQTQQPPRKKVKTDFIDLTMDSENEDEDEDNDEDGDEEEEEVQFNSSSPQRESSQQSTLQEVPR